jgi:hypothetical protein
MVFNYCATRRNLMARPENISADERLLGHAATPRDTQLSGL